MTTVSLRKLRRGDSIKGYEQYGAVVGVVRKNLLRRFVRTESGQELDLFPWERVRLANR